MSGDQVTEANVTEANVTEANVGVDVDIAICGGGMVGASLAVALEGLGLRIALIEAVPHDAAAQPSFDERTTALSNGSRRILETLGVWPALSAAVTPIARIHVSDQGRFGFARVDAAEQHLAAMGFVVPNRALGAALWSRLEGSPGVRMFCPAQVSQVIAGDEAALIKVAAAGTEITLRAQLVVAADGVNSAVRGAFGVAAEVRDYGQTAIITTVLTQRFHDYVAYERFTPSGPLALLPLSDGRCTLVLTLTPPVAEAALAWSDEQFLAEVQSRFGFRLGRFLKVGRRVPYPLTLSRAAATSRGRCVIIGNAAQGLHPVAGMGFNLGLRDAASLAELVAEQRGAPQGGGAHAAAGHGDLGAPGLLAGYDAWRAADRGGIIAFTDGLVRVFSNPLRGVQRLRNLGLLAFDLLPPAKSALSRLSTGCRGTDSEARARGCAAMKRTASEVDFDCLIVGAGGDRHHHGDAAARAQCGAARTGRRDRCRRRPTRHRRLGAAGVRTEPCLATGARDLRRVAGTAGRPDLRLRTLERVGRARRAARQRLTDVRLCRTRRTESRLHRGGARAQERVRARGDGHGRRDD